MKRCRADGEVRFAVPMACGVTFQPKSDNLGRRMVGQC